MSEKRKQPGMTWWIIIALFAALAYPASFGPACWMTSHFAHDGKLVSLAYRPILDRMYSRPKPIWKGAKWYAEVFSSPKWMLGFSTQDGTGYWENTN